MFVSSETDPLAWIAYADDDLSLLSAYAAHVCYPGDEPIVEEAKDALAAAATVRRFVRRLPEPIRITVTG